MDLPGVTVVVPVYNQAARLRYTMPAVLALHGVAAWIWVDDGSTDGTGLTIESVIANSSDATRKRATYLRHPANRGRAAARNTGLAEVTTPVVLFLDADVRPESDAAQAHARCYHDSSVVATLSEIEPEALDPSNPLHAYWLDRTLPTAGEPLPLKNLIMTATAFRTDALRAVGGFDERIVYGEDLDVAWRLAARHPQGFRLAEGARVGQGALDTLGERRDKLRQFGRELPALLERHPGLDRAADLRAVTRPFVRAALRRAEPLIERILPATRGTIQRRLVRLLLAASVAAGFDDALSSRSRAQ